MNALLEEIQRLRQENASLRAELAELHEAYARDGGSVGNGHWDRYPTQEEFEASNRECEQQEDRRRPVLSCPRRIPAMKNNLYGETAPDVGSFAEKVCFLDCALTRCLYHEAIRTWRNQKNSYGKPQDWFQSGGYHLSDGGYSRLHCRADCTLFLSSNSRDEVKKQWEYCEELIADVEHCVKLSINEPF